MVATMAAEAAEELADAQSVHSVPVYGMAVAHALNSVREITALLGRRGAKFRLAIHPVAGRLPWHMNVRLAETHRTYEILLEMDDIHGNFASSGVALAVGAKDIMNPSELDDLTSHIAGTPARSAWEAASCIVFNRGRGAW